MKRTQDLMDEIDFIPNDYPPEQLDKDITRMQEKKPFRELMESAAKERKTADMAKDISLHLKKEKCKVTFNNVIKHYKEYSVKNNIYFKEDEISTKNLIKKCNQYHQHYLLYINNNGRGTKIETKCYKNYYSDGKCNGWYTNEKRCDCGVKWCWNEEDTDYTNLHHINISYTEPTGNPEKY